MSKETINLDLSLAPPNSSHIQSSPAVQESPNDDINLDLSLATPQSLQEYVQESVQEPLQKSLQESVQELVQKSLQESVQKSLQESIQEYIQEYLQESVQKSLQESIQESIQEYLQESVQKSLQQSLQKSTQESLQESLQESRDNSLLTPPPLSQQLIPQETQPEEEITILHQWAKSSAEVHTLSYLISKNINMISGEVICKSCKKRESLEYNLREKFAEVSNYIKENQWKLGHKASTEWMKPELGRCGSCITGRCKPVISEKKEEINWLFLMLGQMLGCCRLEQLQYFCDKNRQPRNYNKDTLVYIAYVVICNQLNPTMCF